MIFDVDSSQIEKLDSKQLVELLKKLLHAEAQHSGISLRGVSVPLQITVADGGEDARIIWEDGLEQTNYLPSRFCIFQSKATKAGRMGKAGWKKEVWTKPSQKKGAVRELNDAIKIAINENGSYIGFTCAILIGSRKDDRIDGIKEGIREAGEDPNRLNINIYDANKIADWVSEYPAVAVWLNEQQSGLNLRSFQTVEKLGKKPDIFSIPQIEDKASRFSDTSKKNDGFLVFEKVKERILDHLADPRKSVRVIGSSGVGKTRFVYELVKDESTVAKVIFTTSTIYCDFRDIGNEIYQIAISLAESGSFTTMIVDECPRETAIKLCEIISTNDSNLRIITIGNDNQPIEQDNCLNLSVLPADDTLIEGIIKQRHPKADYSDIDFIRNLSGGYPRIAVLATDNYVEGTPILKSVEDVVERILTGSGINRVEQVRAIECLALFKQLGVDGSSSSEIDIVAEKLARQTGDEMYEHLAHATKQHLVDCRGNYFIAQPIPIAAFLGARRLDLLRVNTILDFIENSPTALRESFLSQWCHFDISRTAFVVAQRLLARGGWCNSLEELSKEIGSQCLQAIVHIDPDGVTAVIWRSYGDLSIDDLKEAETKNRKLVEVLKILVHRKKSFDVAAQLLMRIAAVESKSYSKHTTSRFSQLFQVYYSGTEADPDLRFNILDRGLRSGDERIIHICIEALEHTLKRSGFTGWADLGRIGSQPPLKDWAPKMWGEVFNFQKDGLERLANICTANINLANKCKSIIGRNIRSLLCEYLFDDIEKILKNISKETDIFLEAIEGVGDWLYFNQPEAPEEFSRKVRKLYDELLPTDLIQKALLHTKFWTGNIRNPDSIYIRDLGCSQDIKYSSQKAKEVAAEIALDREIAHRAIRIMVREELNDVFPFTDELAMKLKDPIEALQLAVREFELSTDKVGLQLIRGLIAGIDKRDTESANTCIEIALKSDSLKNQMINIYSVVNISTERLNEIIQYVKQGRIPARECVYFSHGRGLNNLSAIEILPLIDELALNHGSEGIWASLEIISMYKFSQENLEEELALRIKQLITSSQLLKKIGQFGRDGHLFQQLIVFVHEHYGIDDEFATGLSNQIVNLCQVEDHQVFSELNDYCRNIIRLLVKEKPILLWETLSHFFEIATPLEVNYLERLVGSPQNTFDGESQNQEGTLFGILDTEYISWAMVNPKIRTPFLCTFYPLIEIDKTGAKKWHSALVKITHEFGAVEEFRTALARRLYPWSYSNSIIPHLETYLEPLKAWFKHPVSEMSTWARDIHRSLERQIEIEAR